MTQPGGIMFFFEKSILNLKEIKIPVNKQNSLSQTLVGKTSNLTHRFFQFFNSTSKCNPTQKIRSKGVHPDTGISAL